VGVLTTSLDPPLLISEMELRRFTNEEINYIRILGSQGCSGKEIAKIVGRSPGSILSLASREGIDLRPPKRVWHRCRILIEPTLHKVLVLQARKRGMRCGEMVRRLLTTIVAHDLIGELLRSDLSRARKLAAVRATADEQSEQHVTS
jgi:hypothetical protein